MTADRERDRPAPPLKPSRTMLTLEIEQAIAELKRSTGSLLISAFTAGFGVGVSVLLVAAVYTWGAGALSHAAIALIAGNVYAVGFIIVILGRMDLFTEFTTIAVMPVLAGRASVSSLARFWAIIYVGNLIGACVFAVLLVALGREMDIATPAVLVELAHAMADRRWWVILLGAILAGWLMGMLSWLIVGGRDTISQIFFIWIIAFTIGFIPLHHSVVGTAEVVAGMMVDDGIGTGMLLHFLVWTTIGNGIGGVVFAASIHFSIEHDRATPRGEDVREGRESRDR